MLGRANPEFVSDFDQVWAGARALWHDKDPYQVVGPGREFHWRWPLYYPVPALVAVAPLGLVSTLAARGIFAGVSAGAFTWAIFRENWNRWPVFLAISFMVSIELGQWSLLFAAAFLVPAISAFGFTKPNFGAAVAASSGDLRTIVWMALGTISLIVVSQVVEPGWHVPWLANLRAAEHFVAPAQRPLGFLLLLAALRWRRPEARWLLALSLLPQTPSFYDQMLLAVVCLTTRESLVFAVTTVILFVYVGFNVPQPNYAAWGRLVGNATVWFCYLPVLVMVLRRPNEGGLPAVFALVTRLRPGRAT
jgi:hypothetical protein